MNMKVTLDSGKTVELRPMLIADQEIAARNTKGDGNTAVTAIQMQSELIKLLMVKINDKALKGAEKENLDKILTFQEYSQLLQVIQDIMGNPSKPSVEMIKNTGK